MKERIIVKAFECLIILVKAASNNITLTNKMLKILSDSQNIKCLFAPEDSVKLPGIQTGQRFKFSGYLKTNGVNVGLIPVLKIG